MTETPEETPVTIEETMGQVFDQMNLPRGEDGKFAAKEPAKDDAETQAAKPDDIKSEGAETGDAEEIAQEPAEAESEPEETPAIDVPPSWTAEAKEKWSTLPPDLQSYIAERESQAQSKLSELGREVKQAEETLGMFEPLQQLAKQKGVPEDQVVTRFIQAQNMLDANPAAAIQQLAQMYRVDLSQFGMQPQIGENPESAYINALLQEMAGLKQQVAETSNRFTARETAETQAREEAMEQTIEQFAKDKDYWPEIEDEVYHQILALKSANEKKVLADPMAALKEAEQRAIRLVPAVQERLDKAKRQTEEAEKKAEAKRKADEAKKHASLNVKSTTGATAKAAPKSLEAEMEEVYDRIAATG